MPNKSRIFYIRALGGKTLENGSSLFSFKLRKQTGKSMKKQSSFSENEMFADLIGNISHIEEKKKKKEEERFLKNFIEFS